MYIGRTLCRETTLLRNGVGARELRLVGGSFTTGRSDVARTSMARQVSRQGVRQPSSAKHAVRQFEIIETCYEYFV